MRRFLLGGAAIALMAALLVVWLFWWSSGPARGSGGRGHTIIVEEGSSLRRVADQLISIGAVPGTIDSYVAMAKLFGSNDPIQAGEFEIPAGMSGAKVLDLLQHGKPVQRLITVTEGMPSIIVAEKLAANQYLTGAVPAIPEGSLLPDSYSF
ncbi:MAG TPA: endolytic transglycosylase MltG, partial [Sphingomicrobium sp.]|nr:endolytic transglycosylase MltG [Sphingomicrobium sp.]